MIRQAEVTKSLPPANLQFGHFHTLQTCVTFLQLAVFGVRGQVPVPVRIQQFESNLTV